VRLHEVVDLTADGGQQCLVVGGVDHLGDEVRDLAAGVLVEAPGRGPAVPMRAGRVGRSRVLGPVGRLESAVSFPSGSSFKLHPVVGTHKHVMYYRFNFGQRFSSPAWNHLMV